MGGCLDHCKRFNSILSLNETTSCAPCPVVTPGTSPALQVSLGKGTGLPGGEPLPSRNAIKAWSLHRRTKLRLPGPGPHPDLLTQSLRRLGTRSLSEQRYRSHALSQAVFWSFLCQPGSLCTGLSPWKEGLGLPIFVPQYPPQCLLTVSWGMNGWSHG